MQESDNGTLPAFYIRKYLLDLSILKFHPLFISSNSLEASCIYKVLFYPSLSLISEEKTIFVTFNKGDVMIFKV